MRRFARPRPRKSPRIEIIPMVDVMFLLLVFYVLSSIALTPNQGISVQLPSAQSGQNSSVAAPLTLSVDAQGQVYLEKKPIPVAQLGAQVQQWCQNRPGGLIGLQKAGVILQADQASAIHQTVAVMDQLRQIGLYQISISTQKP